uniref:RNA polymerase II subunit B1 CTD phosphatase RPAP2 homolog n=1 Tax=Monopterus albus TaxID=43700 RepID=A0A3Q3Q2I8_MONAL
MAGGKCTKALTDEEEEKRREDLREKLREKLELEKSSLKVVERLLEDSVAADFLVDCAKFITTDNYKDAVEERFIAKLCGYPLCPNKLGKIPSQQYKISTKTNKVYDITERKCFCSNFCYKASKTFELQISPTPLWLRHHESPPEITLMKKRDGYVQSKLQFIMDVTVQDQCMKDPVLPLVDSCAQHLIQKRITVDKISSCLRNIVGSLHLTMSNVSTDLNNLVRTFRFTNTNVIHKTPEWTLIAVVLLHLLSEVSPVVQEALKTPASVEYLSTLMDELGLQEQDLLNLVQLFKTPPQ